MINGDIFALTLGGEVTGFIAVHVRGVDIDVLTTLHNIPGLQDAILKQATGNNPAAKLFRLNTRLWGQVDFHKAEEVIIDVSPGTPIVRFNGRLIMPEPQQPWATVS